MSPAEEHFGVELITEPIFGMKMYVPKRDRYITP